jgi:predicted DCC family thiol-disulfide oxidoreductase YuxK
VGPHIILYDGVCGLCNRLNQFVLKRDRRERFGFAALQSTYATELLARYGRDPRDLDTVYVVIDAGLPTEQLLSEGRAILRIIEELGGIWKLMAVFRILPWAVINFFYRRVARNRYRLFGKTDACMLPDPRWKARFLDAGS